MPSLGEYDPATGSTALFSIAGGDSYGITTGPGGNIWFTSYTSSLVGMAEVLPDNVVAGNVYRDLKADGNLDPGDPGLAGRTVYLDLQGDGKLDPGDPTATTDAYGNYVLTSARLRQLCPASCSLPRRYDHRSECLGRSNHAGER